MYRTICVANIKALISFAVTTPLFSHMQIVCFLMRRLICSTTRHFQLSLRYDIGYTRNFNRFLGGISRLSNVVGDNHILLVPVHDQMCLITFVPCFISSSEGI